MEVSKSIIERSKELKKIKGLANTCLTDNKEYKKNRKNSWENLVVENNIVRLREIIQDLNEQLEEKAIEAYFQKKESSHNQLREQYPFFASLNILDTIDKFRTNGEILKIFQYSPTYSIKYDLYWIDEDGTVGDQIRVASGEESPNVYENYNPQKILQIEKEVIPYLEQFKDYTTVSKLLKELTKGFDRNSHIVSNIILITITENLVRTLCKFVYSKQNPSLTKIKTASYVDDFQSLERLINKGNWKSDIDINITEAYMMSEHVVGDDDLSNARKLFKENKSNEKLFAELFNQKLTQIKNSLASDSGADSIQGQFEELEKELKKFEAKSIDVKTYKIKISLKAKLHFLIRRYKEDRNSIIHGHFEDFDKGWKSFIYMSAIVKIWRLIKLYHDKYKRV